MAMAPGRLRTPGKRVHSEPTRRPIVRSGALELAGAKRSIRGSLLRSTKQWTRAWPSLLLAGGKRAPFSRRPSLTPESTTISAGQALRRAALRFYAQARVDRHTAHKAHARRLTNPVPPLANEGEFPQLPRPALRRRTRRQPPGTRPPTNPSAKRATE